MCIKTFMLKISTALAICFLLMSSHHCWAECQPLEDKPLYALSIYAAQMTDNSIDDFIDISDSLDFKDSHLLTVALAKRIATYRNLASLEFEGQVVKHFGQQDHFEFNALLTARWEEFVWDKYLNTSFAIGVGPSYATQVPEIEVQRSGDSARLQAYLMMELEFVLPAHSAVAVFARIHHRSNAFGIVANSGISNALAFGLRFRI